ncbi:hypothetical protein SNEBB_007374 [Seison nebaliae]|nr:hypothetical protein SNEBB_007374 [Seison nebaliae]
MSSSDYNNSVVKLNLRDPVTGVLIDEKSESICGRIDPKLTKQVNTKTFTEMGTLIDVRPYTGCPGDDTTLDLPDNMVLLVDRGNCSTAERIVEARYKYQEKITMILVSSEKRFYPHHSTDLNVTNITVVVVKTSDIDDALEGNTKNLSSLFMITFKPITAANPTLAIVLGLTISVVLFGSVWAYKEEKHYIVELREGKLEPRIRGENVKEIEDESASNVINDVPADEENITANNNKLKKMFRKKRRVHSSFSSWMIYKFPDGWPRVQRYTPIALLILFLSAFIFLYLFYDQTIWFFNSFFFIAAPISLYRAIMFAFTFSKKAKHRSEKHLLLRKSIRCCPFHFAWMEVFILIFCYAFASTWFVIRFNQNSWILHIVLWFFFACDIIRAVKIKSWKWLTIFMILGTAYDVFLVYISPLFTRNGQSLIEYFSRGPWVDGEDTVEKLSTVFHVPYFPYPDKCIGDVELIVYIEDAVSAGIVVSSTFIWELMNERNWNPILFGLSYLAFLIGIAIIYAISFVTLIGHSQFVMVQPLLWITITTYLLIKKEFMNYWKADPYYDVIVSEGHSTYDEYSEEEK